MRISEWIRESENDGVRSEEGDHFIRRNSSPSLSLALSNRASCLLRAGHFEAALEDIDLAIWAGYPEEKLHRFIGSALFQCLDWDLNSDLILKDDRRGEACH